MTNRPSEIGVNNLRYKIRDYLNSLPRSSFKVNGPGSPTGEPDIDGCLDGRYVAVEVKVPGKKPKRHQGYRLKKLAAAGAFTFCAHSVEETREEIKRGLPSAVPHR